MNRRGAIAALLAIIRGKGLRQENTTTMWWGSKEEETKPVELMLISPIVVTNADHTREVTLTVDEIMDALEQPNIDWREIEIDTHNGRD